MQGAGGALCETALISCACFVALRRTQTSYLGATVQTMSANFDLKTHTLSFQEFSHRHLAKNVAAALHKTIYVDNGLEVQKGYTFEAIVADGGPDMVSATRDFLHPRYHCANHNLDLAIKKSLKTPGVKRIIKKVNLFIKLQRKSPR